MAEKEAIASRKRAYTRARTHNTPRPHSHPATSLYIRHAAPDGFCLRTLRGEQVRNVIAFQALPQALFAFASTPDSASRASMQAITQSHQDHRHGRETHARGKHELSMAEAGRGISASASASTHCSSARSSRLCNDFTSGDRAAAPLPAAPPELLMLLFSKLHALRAGAPEGGSASTAAYMQNLLGWSRTLHQVKGTHRLRPSSPPTACLSSPCNRQHAHKKE